MCPLRREGYYAEDEDLTNYFRLMRALQDVPLEYAVKVEESPQFHRLLAVTSSAIFGPPVRKFLLPKGGDPLSAALDEAALNGLEWTLPELTAAAAKIARKTGDYSLVGLAARAEDPVVLAALRESVVLYAEMMVFGMEPGRRPMYRYVWRVDPELAKAAEGFVDGFNTLFGRELPPPTKKYARAFWIGFDRSYVLGRCVRLGQTPGTEPSYYHWAVIQGPDDQLGVREFWDTEIWTTERYRASGTSLDDLIARVEKHRGRSGYGTLS